MNSESPLRFGVIGAGAFASRRHLPDIGRCPDARLAALCRRDPEALERLRATFEPETVYTDWRRMLEECPLDAVLIATPHALHYEPAREALERGLHVLLEKPMTVSPEEARELRDLAAARGLVLSVALNPPFWAHTHRLRSMLRAGRIGRLEAVDMFWTGNAGYAFGRAPKPANLPGVVAPTMYRADPELCGGGYLIDGGSHLLSEVLWLTERRAERVACLMDETPSDQRAVLTLWLEGGVTATVTCVGDSEAGRRVRNTFAGSKGTVMVEGFEFDVTVRTAEQVDERFVEADLPPVGGPVANFVDAIRGRSELFSPPEHGVHVVEVVDAAYRSAASATVVTL